MWVTPNAVCGEQRYKTFLWATTDAQKNQIQWFRNALRAHEYDAALDQKMLSTYVGEYDRFSVKLEDNKLYLHDFMGHTFMMKPITPTHFLADDWLQLEFISVDGKWLK